MRFLAVCAAAREQRRLPPKEKRRGRASPANPLKIAPRARLVRCSTDRDIICRFDSRQTSEPEIVGRRTAKHTRGKAPAPRTTSGSCRRFDPPRRHDGARRSRVALLERRQRRAAAARAAVAAGHDAVAAHTQHQAVRRRRERAGREGGRAATGAAACGRRRRPSLPRTRPLSSTRPPPPNPHATNPTATSPTASCSARSSRARPLVQAARAAAAR